MTSILTQSLRPDLAAEAGDADGFVGGVAARGIWQQEVLFRVDEVEQRFLAAVELDAADGDGDHLGAAGLNGARRSVGQILYLPVPTIRRERNAFLR